MACVDASRRARADGQVLLFVAALNATCLVAMGNFDRRRYDYSEQARELK